MDFAKRFELLSKAEEQKTNTLSASAIKQKNQDNAVILNFLQQKDVPSWFRGTSKFQMNGANALQNALRDDTEQRTTHRVQACMGQIGLNPLLSNRQVKYLMRLSRGNDLAFLWFLLEKHYRNDTEEITTYSVNEQLIMSAIAHLDMITTMRELDRILPPAQPTKKELEERRRCSEKRNLQRLRSQRKRTSMPYVLPYFEPLVRPKSYGKPLTIPIPDHRVTFGYYDNYKDPNFVVYNEANRWYTDYSMQTGRRIVNTILNEEIANIFADFAQVSLHADTVRTLCEHHKVIKELEDSLEHQLKVVARERCLKNFDTDGIHQEQTRKRIIEELDRDVEKYIIEFRNYAEKLRRQDAMKLVDNSGCCCTNPNLECLCNVSSECSFDVCGNLKEKHAKKAECKGEEVEEDEATKKARKKAEAAKLAAMTPEEKAKEKERIMAEKHKEKEKQKKKDKKEAKRQEKLDNETPSETERRLALECGECSCKCNLPKSSSSLEVVKKKGGKKGDDKKGGDKKAGDKKGDDKKGDDKKGDDKKGDNKKGDDKKKGGKKGDDKKEDDKKEEEKTPEELRKENAIVKEWLTPYKYVDPTIKVEPVKDPNKSESEDSRVCKCKFRAIEVDPNALDDADNEADQGMGEGNVIDSKNDIADNNKTDLKTEKSGGGDKLATKMARDKSKDRGKSIDVVQKQSTKSVAKGKSKKTEETTVDEKQAKGKGTKAEESKGDEKQPKGKGTKTVETKDDAKQAKSKGAKTVETKEDDKQAKGKGTQAEENKDDAKQAKSTKTEEKKTNDKEAKEVKGKDAKTEEKKADDKPAKGKDIKPAEKKTDDKQAKGKGTKPEEKKVDDKLAKGKGTKPEEKKVDDKLAKGKGTKKDEIKTDDKLAKGKGTKKDEIKTDDKLAKGKGTKIEEKKTDDKLAKDKGTKTDITKTDDKQAKGKTDDKLKRGSMKGKPTGTALDSKAAKDEKSKLDATTLDTTFDRQRISIANLEEHTHESADLPSAYDFGHYDGVTPTPSNTFFEAPAENKPYQFDYRKIFRFKENTEDKLCIKRAFIEALNSDVSLLQRLKDEDERPNIPESVRHCATKIWKEGVAIKNIEMDYEMDRLTDPPTEERRKTPLNYDLEYYDPDDRDLMTNMLKDALEYMSRNPKFVLAAMPEAWKLPILREWMCVRYGKEYTRAERFKSFRVSLKIFRALDKVTIQVPMPKVKQLGKKLFIDYSCRDYLIKKATDIKKQYYDSLDAAIMEQARVFWLSMRPYLCSNGPPRDTYFAYMPSRVLDITRFRIWKPTEFVNAKGQWQKRMIQKNKSTFN